MKVPVTEVKEHRKSCRFRPVACPSHLCKIKVPFEHVVDHILNKCNHSYSKNRGALNVVANSSHQAGFNFPAKDLVSTKYSVETFKWNDNFFFLNIKVENEDHRKLYVQMLGTEEECKKYTVEITLKDKTGKHGLTFFDNPLPIEVSEEDLKSGGMQVSNAMKKKVCYPMADKPDFLRWSLLLTFANKTLED